MISCPYRIYKHCTEAFEAIGKSTRIMPVLPANISCRIVGDAARVYDNTQDDQPDTGYNFDNSEHELNCSREFQSKTRRTARSERKKDLPSP